MHANLIVLRKIWNILRFFYNEYTENEDLIYRHRLSLQLIHRREMNEVLLKRRKNNTCNNQSTA
jgi:hypothetical protein